MVHVYGCGFTPPPPQGSGDVKYHLGVCTELPNHATGKKIIIPHFAPYRLKDVIEKSHASYDSLMQHDTHEFMSRLPDGLKRMTLKPHIHVAMVPKDVTHTYM